MTKRFLLEQCRRSRVIDEKEFATDFDSPYWLKHNKGHESLRSEFENLLNSSAETVDINYLKKWLKAQTRACLSVYDEMDARYDYAIEKMCPEDEDLYIHSEGRDCMASLLFRILRKEHYIWKGCCPY